MEWLLWAKQVSPHTSTGSDASQCLVLAHQYTNPPRYGKEHREDRLKGSEEEIMCGWISAQHIARRPTDATGKPSRKEQEHVAEHIPYNG